jgi:hypothetical protein
MRTRTISQDRRLTLGKELMEHLGVRNGDKIELEFLPNNSIRLTAATSAKRSKTADQGERPQKSKPA